MSLPNKPPADVSIVIVNYNRAKLLARCLDLAFKNKGDLSLEIHVVDNGSTDGSVLTLREHYPGVHAIVNDQNLDFARANNQAFPFCRGRYILLLNNDAVLTEGALPTLVELMDRRLDIGAVGPRLIEADGTVQPSCMHFPSLLGALRGFMLARLGWQAKRIPDVDGDFAPVDSVSGACLLIRHEAMDEVGLLDEAFFMYGEETDWCYGASRLGFMSRGVAASQACF